MQNFKDILLNIWREASQQVEIGESTAKIAEQLADHLPLGHIIVRILDLPHSCLETIAVGTSGNSTLPTIGRTECKPALLKQLAAWVKNGTVLRAAKPATGMKEIVQAWMGEINGDCLLGPLVGHEERPGALLLVAKPRAQFEDQHIKLLEALLEPFSAALENDRRLHELSALREAAETNRRSLFTKSGPKELAAPIIGSSGGLGSVIERVQTVSGSDMPVLLLGETGTGKEVIARTVHDRSGRHDSPFIRVNCGAIPAELIDSQLFGHERGSFTGAVDTHKGWFERADGGTLFLDEIGELPLAAQVRLLRVLQDGFIERVGGKKPIHVNVRVVAATHRDLAKMVQEGRFREDLWYRIAAFPIAIPPLRQRLEDIPALACHFAEKAATRFGLALVMPTQEDLHLLTTYSWPGNVRELAAVLDRAALLGNGQRLEVAKSLGATPTTSATGNPLPQAAMFSNMGTHTQPTTPSAHTAGAHSISDSHPPMAHEPAIASLDEANRRHIEAALHASHGRIEGPFGAAKRLKINPHTLRARMRKLKIDWRKYRDSEE